MRNVRGIIVALVGLVLLASPWSSGITPLLAQQPGQNLLVNPSFEGPYQSDGAASGWVAWHEDSGAPCAANQYPWNFVCRPSWWQELDYNHYGLTRSGSSQAVGVSSFPWHAGVWQTVNIAPGTRVRFSVWARAYISNDDLPAASFGGWNPTLQVGIDPEGRGQWNAPGLVWSGPINVLDQWVLLSVEATAGGSGRVSVFVSGSTRDQMPLKHNDTWWDDAVLEVVAPAATPTPPPTATPTRPRLQAAFAGETVPDGTAFDGGAAFTKTWRLRNSGTDAWPDNTALVFASGEKMGGPDSVPVGQVQPGEVKEISINLIAPSTPGNYSGTWALQTGATRIPGGELWVSIQVTQPAAPTVPPASPTPEATPTPETGSVCVLAFHDRNGDTFRQPDSEELLPNAVFSLGDASGLLGQYTTDGLNEPHCFSGLAPGSYRVVMQPPAGYVASGPSTMALALTTLARLEVAFGAQRGETPLTQTPAVIVPSGTEEGGAIGSQVLRWAARVGGVVLLALAVATALLFVLSRRRR